MSDDGTSGQLDDVTVTTGVLADIAVIRSMLERTTAVDGVSPLSEQARLHLASGGSEKVRHLILRTPAGVAGYAQLQLGEDAAGATAELFVDPAVRGQGHGATLLAAVRAGAASAVRVWAHGDLPAAAALAARAGMTRVRVLHQLSRPMLGALPSPVLPEGVSLRSFRASDAGEWLRVNARAFAAHPEQGRWTQDDLQLRMQESWFSEDGFIIAVRESDDAMLGFAWTKTDATAPGAGRTLTGELYVIGVDPDAQGTGLGRALVLAALAHLRTIKANSAKLYVDADNVPAMRLYASLGFGTVGTDVMWA